MEFSISSLPLPVRLRSAVPMTDDEFLLFCERNDLLQIERQSSGEIIIMSPAGGESDRREMFVASELMYWAEENGRGVSYGSNAGFILPDGATLSPDAAWVSLEVWQSVPPAQREKFLPFCPAFVVEVLSPSDSRRDAHLKMQQWIANGAQLGWLFDPFRKTVAIYRPGSSESPKILQELDSIEAAEPVPGFRLTLRRMWA